MDNAVYSTYGNDLQNIILIVLGRQNQEITIDNIGSYVLIVQKLIEEKTTSISNLSYNLERIKLENSKTTQKNILENINATNISLGQKYNNELIEANNKRIRQYETSFQQFERELRFFELLKILLNQNVSSTE